MPRSRAETEGKLLEAVGQLIAEAGADNVGINRVAALAGVHKVLIYRYFGDLSGLINAYIARGSTFNDRELPDVEELRQLPLDEFYDVCCELTIQKFRELRQNAEAQAFLRPRSSAPT